ARYLAALGFRTLKLSPQIWTDPERLILQNNEKEKKDAENYQKVSNDLVAVQKEYEETKRKLAIQQDNDAIKLNDPGNYPDYAANQKTLENIKTKIQALEVEMQKQTTIFHEYETQYNKESANFLIEFANNVKLIDKKIRDREKILNSIEYYRSNYDGTFQQTWKLESREMAYAGLLEMSCLLDPQNAKTPALLGEMYKNAGEDLLAISSLERSLKFNETSSLKFSDTELYEIYKNLGGLYYATRRYVDSAWYYEKVIAIKRSPDMEFQLAKIHTENTGNYERARELLGNLLLAYKQPVNTKLEDASVLDALKTRFQTLSFLVTIFEKTGPEKKLVDYLKQLLEIHASLEKMISDSYDNLRVDEKKMTDARIQLNQKPDQTSLQTFYTDQQKFRDQKEITQKMEALRKTLNLQKVYFTLAYQNEVQNDVAGAIEVYRRAESYGIDPDRARREIMRLQKK
ncbi:MAG: hypothetical protein OEV66_12510, partial [Spirochaetia bacterium]|nr:hypothetical protein [Spirochaetia bacterium]